MRAPLLVALAVVETLTCTGVFFGFAFVGNALKRDGYRACADDGPCNSQTLRLQAIYAVGTTAMPVAFVLTGRALDAFGSQLTRALGAVLFAAGAALAAASAHGSFDAFLPAAAVTGLGAAPFFLSHFVIAEHTEHHGTVHALLNCAFDSSTAVFLLFDLVHLHFGVSLAACFAALAGLALVYAILSTDKVWAHYLKQPAGAAATTAAASSPLAKPPPKYGAALDVSHLPFPKQLRTPHFAFVAAWGLFTVWRTCFVLGSIKEQLRMNAGGRTEAQAQDLSQIFGTLILVSAAVTPFFGMLVDRIGLAAGFAIVNGLGILSYALLLCQDRALLLLGFVLFGCFRGANYTLMTTYVQGIFGPASFGRVYGEALGVLFVIAAGLVYPVAYLVAAAGWRDYAPVNLACIALSGLFFAFPSWLFAKRAPV